MISAQVKYTVWGVERVRSGTLLGLAIVDVEIAGIAIQLQGVQILRNRSGDLEVRAPRFRDGQGIWRSAVIMPAELSGALAAEILSMFDDT